MCLLQKVWILGFFLVIIVFQHTTSAPVHRCKGSAKPSKLKNHYSKLKSGRWILVERFNPVLNIRTHMPLFSNRRRRNINLSRPSDVPSTHCPWRWEYDFDQNREPQYLPQAVCNNCNRLECHKVDMVYKVLVKSCQKINAKGRYIHLWKRSTISLPVAFYYKKR